MMESITLFSGVEILPTLSKRHAIEYLKRYCTIDDLGDSIYVKKLGNDPTTFAIDFESDEIDTMRKIKDEDGNSIEEIIFDGVNDVEDDDCDSDENTAPDDLVVCPECDTKCETQYHLSEADEFSDEELIPFYSECPKCGWSVC